uniref:Putative FG-GAP repeat protein n=1 Tax=uncultured marine microorganism HF4000_008B14 TaxID=455512 RepID=B3T130_9ZZZZ|nr:putative FG-GAP repeat protein [uncultured marine microorganism HF4000_008B14]
MVTPHIGGTVEFYRLEDDILRVVAKVPGFRTHAIGSRNLDMAVAGDFDGDGRIEILVPSQGMDEIGAIRRTEEGAEVAWTLPIDGKVSTNLAAVSSDSGGLTLGVGRNDGVLLVWPAS